MALGGRHLDRGNARLEQIHEVFVASPVAAYPLSILNLVQFLPEQEKSLSLRAQQLRHVPEEHLGRLIDSDQRRAVVSTRLPDVMFLMIWFGLRSLGYALASVLPNAFPLLWL